jgi:DNA-directed RNA polymerase subunit RPC12/RpoP
MSIKMECSKCGGHISVDDGFAGSVCRCPYCKETIVVSSRPDAPAASEARPEAPPMARPEPEQIPEATAEAAPKRADSRPLSRKQAHSGRAKRLQMVVIAFLVILGVGLGGVVYILVSNSGGDGPEKQRVDPPTGPQFLGRVPLQPPVVFVIDAGGSMQAHFDKAVGSTMDALKALEPDATTNVYICREGSVIKASEAMSDPRSVLSGLEDLHATMTAGGATIAQRSEALSQAMQAGASQIIALYARAVRDEALLEKLRESSSRLVVISMMRRERGGYEVDDLLAMARAAGGRFLLFDP